MEDIRTEENYNERLPEGWGSIVWADREIPRLSEKRSPYSSSIHPEGYEAFAKGPFRLIMCCVNCSRKLHTMFQERSAAAPAVPTSRRPWWARLLSGL